MAAFLPQFFDVQFFTNDGSIAASHVLYTYDDGTTTPKATYTDATGATPNANPITLNSAGRCSLWLGAGKYSLELKTSGGVLVKRFDGVDSTSSIGTAITADLANAASSTKGAAMVAWGGQSIGYGSGTVGHRLNKRVYVTDPGFAATGDGVTDDTAAFNAAVAYAESIIGSGLDNDLGVEIYLPTGRYKISSKINITKHGISFAGPNGPRGAVIVGTSQVFDVGQYDNTYRVRAFALRNITFYTATTNNTFSCIVLYRALNTIIENCQFVNWYVDIDCFRASQSHFNKLISTKPNRTTTGLASIRLQGLDETAFSTPTSYSPGGGNHITDCEFAGSSSTVDSNAGILVKSSDGLYITQCHFIGFQDTISFSPDASAENYVIVDIHLINCYLDEPSTFSAGSTCVTLGGTVKSTIARDSGTATSVYRGIRIQNCLFRGNLQAVYCLFMRVTDGDSWFDDPNQSFEDLIISGNTLRQSTNRAIQITGAGSGAYVEPRNLIINGNVFDDNNSDGVTGSASDISAAAECITIVNNTFGPFRAAGADYIILVSALDAGATDNPNPNALIANNNLAKCTAPAIDYIRILQTETGSNTVEASNLLPGTGKAINQTYKLTTSDATSTDVWTYAIPEGTSGTADVALSGTNDDGSKAVTYSWRVGFRRNSGGSSLSTGTSAWSAVTAWNPDGFATIPTATLATNTLKVTATGIAATTINWTLHVRLNLSR